MKMTIEMLIYEMAFRVRVFRMSQGTEKRFGKLTDRDMLLLEILNVNDNARISDICKLYPIVSSSTISNSISRLWKEHRLVDKKINPNNQRETTVSLTAKGKKVIEEIKQSHIKVYKTISESLNLTEDEEQVFRDALRKGIDYFDAAVKR